MSRITWGVMSGDKGEQLCTVFCMHCMAVFHPRYVSPQQASEIREAALQSHNCAAVRAEKAKQLEIIYGMAV